MLSERTKTFITDKVVRFETHLHVCHLRVNNDGEVVIFFNEDPREFKLSVDRTDIFVFIPGKA